LRSLAYTNVILGRLDQEEQLLSALYRPAGSAKRSANARLSRVAHKLLVIGRTSFLRDELANRPRLQIPFDRLNTEACQRFNQRLEGLASKVTQSHHSVA